jgi:serine/threonine-protein kinase RsbW
MKPPPSNPKPSSSWTFDQRIASDPGAGRKVVRKVLAELQAQNWTQQDVFGVHLALEEALVNAIRHGNRGDKQKRIQVSCSISLDRLRIEIRDEGPGFDPAEVPDPTDPTNILIPSGRGIMLMRTFMSRVEYSGAGNCVVMEKERARSA